MHFHCPLYEKRTYDVQINSYYLQGLVTWSPAAFLNEGFWTFHWIQMLDNTLAVHTCTSLGR